MVRYLDPFYGTDITESVFYKLASLHRTEIIKDFEDGSVFRITYSYVTRRGKTRVHEKFIFSSCQWWHGEDGQKKSFFGGFPHLTKEIHSARYLRLKFCGVMLMPMHK